MVFRGEAFRRWLDYEGAAFTNGIRALIKEAGGILIPFTTRGYSEKTAPSGRSWPSPDSESAGALTVDFLPPELWEIGFYCLSATQSVVFCYNTLNGLKHSDFSLHSFLAFLLEHLLSVALSWVHRLHGLCFILCIILRRGPWSSSNCKKGSMAQNGLNALTRLRFNACVLQFSTLLPDIFWNINIICHHPQNPQMFPTASRMKSKLKCMTIKYVHNWLLLISSASHTLQLKSRAASAILSILHAFSLLSAFAQAVPLFHTQLQHHLLREALLAPLHSQYQKDALSVLTSLCGDPPEHFPHGV